MSLKEAWAKYANYCKECALKNDEPLSFGDWVCSKLNDVIEEYEEDNEYYYLFENNCLTAAQLDNIQNDILERKVNAIDLDDIAKEYPSLNEIKNGLER
ncbi:MAG: hypothetical protein K6F71_00075 [Ruminococcus sp.]|uniref:hypothetical protein n=1 Tax=Ruminococcus sp. TaxID=41978 RepID=UPI0025FFAF85|nr:hypothetical protein [Ruminococcus sp.]MCR5539219.1 hypothetical protein [Ruminococcus sp.]